MGACLFNFGIKPTLGISGIYERVLFILFSEAHRSIGFKELSVDSISDKAQAGLIRIKAKIKNGAL